MMYGNTGNVGSDLPSSGAAASPPPIAYPLLHHHQLHHTIMIPLQPAPSLPPCPSVGNDDECLIRDERLPQWSNHETRDLIEIRAQLEWGFTPLNSDETLWEMVAEGMRDKGYRRTADHCECKWMSLINRYMGQEASDVDSVEPFFNELHAVFTIQQQAEPVLVRGKRLKDSSEDQSYEEIEVAHPTIKKTERKTGRDKRQKIDVNKKGSTVNGLKEIMRSFIEQQQRIDMEWRESMKKRGEERERFEQEWRQKMESLERERLVMERAWRERDEERRVREERRAEQRDALLSALLNKLIHEESSS